MDNTRIILPFFLSLGIGETGSRIKIPLKGKGTLETLTFYSLSASYILVTQKDKTKGLRVFGKATTGLTDDFTTNAKQEMLVPYDNPTTISVNLKYEDTFLELWFDSYSASAEYCCVIIRINEKKEVIKK